MLKRYKHLLPYIIFVVVTLVILFPLLKPGFILTFDLVFSPKMFPTNGYGLLNEVPRDYLLFFLSKLIPAEVLEKILLLLIFFFMQVGVYKTLKLLKIGTIVSTLAAILYLWNPFVYTRFLAGHWTFLAGMAASPFSILLLSKLKSKSFIKQIVAISGFWYAISLINIHHIVLIIPFLILGLLINKYELKQSIKLFVASCLVTLLLSLSWIVPSIGTMSTSDFLTTSYPTSTNMQLGLIGNTLVYQGFWAEKTLGQLNSDISNFWFLIPLLIYTVVAVGAYLLIKKSKKTILGILLLGLIVFNTLLALGNNGIMYYFWKLLEPTYLTSLFREPQKFLAISIFCLCILFAFGLTGLLKASSKYLKLLLITGSTIMIILFSPLLFWGLNNQLTTVGYPESWSVLSSLLAANPNSKVLFLPLTSYDDYVFSGRRLANPAASYFGENVIYKKCLGDCFGEEAEIIYQLKLLSPEEMMIILKQENIKYILIAKTTGSSTNNDLYNNSNYFQQILQDKFTTVYEVK